MLSFVALLMIVIFFAWVKLLQKYAHFLGLPGFTFLFHSPAVSSHKIACVVSGSWKKQYETENNFFTPCWCAKSFEEWINDESQPMPDIQDHCQKCNANVTAKQWQVNSWMQKYLWFVTSTVWLKKKKSSPPTGEEGNTWEVGRTSEKFVFKAQLLFLYPTCGDGSKKINLLQTYKQTSQIPKADKLKICLHGGSLSLISCSHFSDIQYSC